MDIRSVQRGWSWCTGLVNKWTALTVTTVGVSMAAIGQRIVVVGLPQVSSALGADAEQAIWFSQAYLIVITVSMLLVGRIADVVGRVKLYTWGFAIFTAASALISLAQTPDEVIVFRAVQGFGAAIILTNSVALITDATPRKELGFALSINQISIRIGAVAGLTISGIILTYLPWQALFYINIPVGIFGTVWAHLRLKEIVKVERESPIDWVGFAAFATSVSAFLLALTFSAYGISNSGLVWVLGAISAASLAGFVFHERRTPSPLLDLNILRIRRLTGGILALLFNGTAFGGVLIIVSIYFQLVRGLTPLQAGLSILPFDFATLVVAPISGKLSDRFGYLPLTTAGLLFNGLGLLLFSTADATTPFALVSAYLVLLGIGTGSFNAPNVSAIMGSVPAARRGIASGLRYTFSNLGQTLSLNVVILVMASYVPYSLLSAVIASGTQTTVAEAFRLPFASALGSAFFWLGIIDLVALAPSILRGGANEGEGGPRLQKTREPGRGVS